MPARWRVRRSARAAANARDAHGPIDPPHVPVPPQTVGPLGCPLLAPVCRDPITTPGTSIGPASIDPAGTLAEQLRALAGEGETMHELLA